MNNLLFFLFVSFLPKGCCLIPLHRSKNPRSGFVARTFLPTRNIDGRLHVSTKLELPQLTKQHLRELQERNFVVIPHFLSSDFVSKLRSDVTTLRKNERFKVAKIGQDSTNQLNQNIRLAETCFLSKKKLLDVPNEYRDDLYSVLSQLRTDLSKTLGISLDENLSELLYAYYPEGGYYRRHRDAIPGSASTLRSYSLLVYLNKDDWRIGDGGELRMHFDTGGDFLPVNETPNYLDVNPTTGTLVLFKSDCIPHEVLDTKSERMAVVGWYNRPVTAADLTNLSDPKELSPVRLAMLAIAFSMVVGGTKANNFKLGNITMNMFLESYRGVYLPLLPHFGNYASPLIATFAYFLLLQYPQQM